MAVFSDAVFTSVECYTFRGQWRKTGL